jgi:hypothetical protein
MTLGLGTHRSTPHLVVSPASHVAAGLGVLFFELGDINTSAFTAPAVMKSCNLSISTISLARFCGRLSACSWGQREVTGFPIGSAEEGR